MNKKHILGLGLILTIFAYCDKVEDPYKHLGTAIGDYGNSRFDDTLISDTASANRMIVIEDFTGHTCGNCPRAARIAKKIHEQNPKKTIIIAIHNSINYSKPDPPDYPANFETTTGENLREAFILTSFPKGVINRKDFDNNPNNSIGVNDLEWEGEINDLLSDNDYMNPSLDITFTAIYNTGTNTIRIYPKIKVNKNITGEVYLSCFLLENGIISPQLDDKATPVYVEKYVHNHLLRVGFEQNDVGTLIFTNPKTNDVYDKVNIATSDVKLNNSWKIDSLDLLVFAYNRITKEILQVTKKGLKDRKKH